MKGQPAMSFAFPKPGPAPWTLLAATACLGLFTAFLGTWVGGGELVFRALECQPDHPWAQPWRLLTSGLLTSPASSSHLFFSLLGLYFLSPPLERRWGSVRFAWFVAIAVILGNLATIAVASAVPADAQERFHPELVFGPTAIITAIAVGWSREFHDATVNLFFFVPMRGKTLLWVTIGICVLDLVYPTGLPEGVAAPFGGIVAGLVFSGSPSLARTAWLRLRLAVLHRRASSLRVEDVLSAKMKQRPRAGRPPLRVVSGGADDKKQPPPKDKRYLN